MKKIIMFLICSTFLLTGCISDTNYIETVRAIEFNNGESIDDVVSKKLSGAEFKAKNEDNITIDRGMAVFKSTGEYAFLLKGIGIEPELREMCIKAGVKGIYPKNITWEIEGETNEGKIIKVSSDYATVKIKTQLNGDYIEIQNKDIVTLLKGNAKAFDSEILDEYDFFNNLLIDKEVKNTIKANIVEGNIILNLSNELTLLVDKINKEIRSRLNPKIVEKEFILKLKSKKLPYEISNLKETSDSLEIVYIVNGKRLIYNFYKNEAAYNKGIVDFEEDDFLIKERKEKLKNNYMKYMLSPMIESPVYGRWEALIGENQIIKASGDNFVASDDNLNEFFNNLQKIKKL